MACKMKKSKVKAFMKRNALLIANMVAIVLGLILGFGLRTVSPSSDAIIWIGLWGELFIRMIKMLVLPLIVINLILGVSSLETSASGRVGVVSLLYIYITQLIACIIGASLALIVKPGVNMSKDQKVKVFNESSHYGDVFADLLRNLFPNNLVEATFQQVKTVRTIEITNATANLTKEVIEQTIVPGMNALGITLFSILFGIGIVVIGEPLQSFVSLLKGINEVIFWLLKLVTWYSPLGIVSLIASALLKADNLSGAVSSLGWLVLCVFIGCILHTVLFIHLPYLIIIRKNPLKYNLAILDGVLAAFSPPSGAVALPYLFKACEEKLGIDKRVTQFFLPLSITLNKDGSVLFVCVAAVFVAQSFGVTLNAATVFALIFMVSALSVAIAAVPSASVILLLMLSSIVGVPIADRIGLIMAVEWLTDRIRTVPNIISNGFGCALIERFSIKPAVKTEGENRNKENGDFIEAQELEPFQGHLANK